MASVLKFHPPKDHHLRASGQDYRAVARSCAPLLRFRDMGEMDHVAPAPTALLDQVPARRLRGASASIFNVPRGSASTPKWQPGGESNIGPVSRSCETRR